MAERETERLRSRRTIVNNDAQVRALLSTREAVQRELNDARDALLPLSPLSVRNAQQLALVGRTNFQGIVVVHPSVPKEVIQAFKAAHPGIAVLPPHN